MVKLHAHTHTHVRTHIHTHTLGSHTPSKSSHLVGQDTSADAPRSRLLRFRQDPEPDALAIETTTRAAKSRCARTEPQTPTLPPRGEECCLVTDVGSCERTRVQRSTNGHVSNHDWIETNQQPKRAFRPTMNRFYRVPRRRINDINEHRHPANMQSHRHPRQQAPEVSYLICNHCL